MQSKTRTDNIGAYTRSLRISEPAVLSLIANILTVLCYVVAVVYFGVDNYQNHHSLEEAFLAAGQLFCILVGSIFLFDLFLSNLYAPNSWLQRWLARRRS
jgi:hypothetical protein